MTLKQLKQANKGNHLLSFELDYWCNASQSIVTITQHAPTEETFKQLMRDKGLANSTYRRLD